MKKRSFTVAFVLISFLSIAQVREVKSRASEYKSNKSSSSTDNSYSYFGDDGEGSLLVSLFSDLFVGTLINGFSAAQYAQMNNAAEEDWRKSLEIGLSGGLNCREVEFFDRQMIRGNWGLFSTQLRRFNVNDVSGAFTTIDWQVLQFNLINLEKVRWVLGLGISHETQINQTHFEWASEFYVMIKNKFSPYLTYRQSEDGYPRREFTGMLEFRPFYNRHAEFSFVGGYVHQKIYDIGFNFLSTGVMFRLK